MTGFFVVQRRDKTKGHVAWGRYHLVRHVNRPIDLLFALVVTSWRGKHAVFLPRKK